MPLRDPRWVVTAAAALVFVLLAATLTSVWDGTAEVSDVPHYDETGLRIQLGGVPYRDVAFEYPPGALPAIVAPEYLSHTFEGYAQVFAAGMVLCGVAAIVFAAIALARLDAGVGRTAAALSLPALSPVLLGPLLLTRFDLLPAALAVGALAAVLAGRDRLGGGVLGLGVAVKLWPALLLPLFLAWWRRRQDRRIALTGLVICIGVAAAIVLVPWIALAPAELVESLWRQGSRPLQIESLGAAVLLALHHAFGMPLDWASSSGSQNLTGAVAVVAAAVTSVAQLAVLGWLWWRFARGPFVDERLVRYAAATVVAFVALGKVLSPQFLIWLVPLVPLVAGARGVAAGLLLACSCLLTRGWFPDDYWALVKQFDSTASWLVLARDATLLALLGLLAWPGAKEQGDPRAAATAKERGPARSPSRVPLPDRT
jgi:Glycosyltransferase family 87